MRHAGDSCPNFSGSNFSSLYYSCFQGFQGCLLGNLGLNSRKLSEDWTGALQFVCVCVCVLKPRWLFRRGTWGPPPAALPQGWASCKSSKSSHTQAPVHWVLSRFQAPPPGWVIQHGSCMSWYNQMCFLWKAFADRLCVLGYQSEVSSSVCCTGQPDR